MILCFISYTAITISIAPINKWNVVMNEVSGLIGGKIQNISTDNIPITNSTSGYCQDILLLQPLQEPFCNKKLIIGMSSFQVNSQLQFTHFDLPFKVLPVLYLIITTFKKLPITAPKIKEKIIIYISILFWSYTIICRIIRGIVTFQSRKIWITITCQT